MDTYCLENFLVICEYGSINKAAQILHISQPSLTRQVFSLENELGVKLFERSSSGVKITSEGLLLKDRAEQILSVKNLLEKDIASKNTLKKVLHFGATTSSIRFALDVLKSYEQKDDLYINLKELNTYELINLLTDDVVDFAFIRTPFELSDAFHHIKMTDDYLVSVGRPEFLNDIGGNTTLDVLSEMPLIINRRWKDYITTTSGNYEIALDYNYLCDDNRTAYMMARKGFGIAILPNSEVHETASDDGLEICRIEEDRFSTGIYLVYRKSREFPRYIQNFIDHVLDKAIA